MKRFLPILLELINKHEDRRYLLLSSLKEIVQQHSTTNSSIELFKVHVNTVSPILLKNSEAKDEGIRGMVAACLGRLLVIDSKFVLPTMVDLVKDKSAAKRVVVITALRFSFTFTSENMTALFYELGPKLDLFLDMVDDPDLEVRRQACLTMNALLRVNESIILRQTLEKLLITLYSATQPKPELITEIDFVAFKKQVDGGLPLRKAAFQTLETLLELAPHRVNLQEYIKNVQQGLVDEYDLQISTWNFFRKCLAAYHASSLLEMLDSLPSLVTKTVQEHLKSVKLAPGSDPTVDPLKAADALRAFVLAIYTFNTIQGVELSKKYTHFVSQVFATPYLKTVMDEVEKAERK